MGVMKELYFDSWKSESYPYAGSTRIRFKGYNLSRKRHPMLLGRKGRNFSNRQCTGRYFSCAVNTIETLFLNADDTD